MRPPANVPSRPGRARFEWAIPAAAAVILTVICAVASGRKLMWGDEILTRLMVRSADAAQMMRAITSGVDGSPPVYWWLLRGWSAVVGASELSLRLFSAAAMGAAFAVTWAVARRVGGMRAAAVGCAVAFFSNRLVFQHTTECRHYALVTALLAALLWAFTRVNRRDRPPGAADRAMFAALTGLLVWTHLFGFVFTGLLLAAQLALDAQARRLSWKNYLAVGIGWASFLPWIPAFQEQSLIGKPWFWIAMPTPTVIADPRSYFFGISGFAIGLVLLLVAARVVARQRDIPLARELRAAWTAARQDPAVVAGVCLIALVPPAALALSFLVKPVWLARYLFPAFVGWVPVLAFLVGRIGRWDEAAPSSPETAPGAAGPATARAWRVALAVLLLGAGGFAWRVYRLPLQPAVGKLPATPYPLVAQGFDDFLYLITYEPQLRTLYVLDWPSALASYDPSYVPIHNLMVAAKRAFPELPVVTGEAFAAEARTFDYVNRRDRAWLRDWLAKHPEARLRREEARTFLMPQGDGGLFEDRRVVRVGPATP